MIIDQKPGRGERIRPELPEKVILDVVMQRELTTYLHRSLPMCAILSNENYRGWYYTNFVQIISHTFENGYVELNYLTPRDGFADVAEVISLGYPMLYLDRDFVSYAMENLCRGYYMVVHIDEFYIPDKGAYEETHFVHASLLYGYDRGKREFYGIGFDEDMTFRKIVFDFDAMNIAFEEGSKNYMQDAFWCEWSAVQLIKPKSPQVPFPFDLRRFMEELEDYLKSEPDLYKLYSFDYDMDSFKCGMSVYDYTAEKLKEAKKGVYLIDYRAIHLIAEHKKGMYDRLEYLKGIYDVSDDYVKLTERYGKIVDKAEKLRLRFMADFLHVRSEVQLTKAEIGTLDFSIGELKEIKKEEGEILKGILKELKHLCKKRR